MPTPCGRYNPEGCTKSCQYCYEGTIAGVKEYGCYGQCVVVDPYGRRHLGPGLGPPAGWKPSAGDSMAEMIADEIANINNSEPTPPTNFVAPAGMCKGKCGTKCGPFDDCYWRSDVLGNCIESWCFGKLIKPPVTPIGTPPWKKKFVDSSRDLTEVDRLTQTTAEEQKAALAAARLNFNKRIGGGIPVPIIPKQYTTIECDSKWCNCQGVKGTCGDSVKCGGQCYWVNHPRVGGTSEPPGACTTCNFKCNPKGAPPESDEDDVAVIRETEQVPKAALAKARKAANFDRNSTNPTMGGSCESCLGNQCRREGYLCYHKPIRTDRGIIWQCECFSSPPVGGGWKLKTIDIPSDLPPPTQMY